MTYDLIKISALPAATPDESQEIVVGVGDLAKRINYGDVKNDMVGTSPSYTTDTEPYLMRRTAHTGVVGKCALEKLVGGSLGWNQLVQSNITLTFATTDTNAKSAGNMPIIANHIYIMVYRQSATLTSALRNTPFYNDGTSTYKTTATNTNLSAGIYQWIFKPSNSKSDGYVGMWCYTPNVSVTYDNIMLTDLTATFGSTIADYVYGLEQATAGAGVAWLSKYIDLGTYHAYDAGSIQSVQATAHVTTGFNQFDEVVEAGYWDATTGQKASGGNWMRCANYIPVLPNTEYKIHFTSGSGSQGSLIYLDGNKSVISYISSYISAVITTPSNCRYMVFYANNGWFRGNICINISKPTGTPKNGDYVPYNGHIYPLGSDTLRGYPMLVNNKLVFDGDEKYPDGTIRRKYGSRAYQSGDTSDGATMITDGTTTVYKLATPTTESSTAFQKVQTIDADGTESFTTSSPVPVGHETQTPDNVLAALGWLGE